MSFYILYGRGKTTQKIYQNTGDRLPVRMTVLSGQEAEPRDGLAGKEGPQPSPSLQVRSTPPSSVLSR